MLVGGGSNAANASVATASRSFLASLFETGGFSIGLKAIAYCADTYRVTTADGKIHQFWERNLRFKTDAGEDGPHKKAPALVGAGMMGDRADVIFAAPEEISGFIIARC